MFKFGTLELKNNLFSAPMLDVSDYPFRYMCRKYGAGMTFSEMTSAAGIVKNEFDALKISTVSADEHPVGVQILGNKPEYMADASVILEERGADAVLINAGCSVQQVVNLGFGAALIDDIDLLSRITSESKKAVKKLPVSVKIRAGKNQKRINVQDTIKKLQQAGADVIIVHGRTRNMEYSEKSNWHWIQMAKEVADIPIIGNGDIFSPEDAEKMFKTTGVDGIMIARGSLGNPFIFSQILDDNKSNRPGISDYFDACIEHLDLLIKDKGEITGVRNSRKFIMWYLMNFKFSLTLKDEVFGIESYSQIRDMLLKNKELYSGKEFNEFYTKDNFNKFLMRVNYWLV